MVCSTPLTYHEKAEELKCLYCGRLEHGHISCPSGHYICDLCHNRDSMRIIEDTIFSATSHNPFEIAEIAMSFPGLPMLGCQHAYVAGGALMAAIKNAGHKGVTNEEIKEVFKRTGKQAHGGYCGLTGVCGIAPAIGACFAVLTGSKCGKDQEQRVTMEAVTRVARAITELTGPSCCKAYVRTSLDKAVEYLGESLGIQLPPADRVVCNYSLKHPHGCRETLCPFFNENDYGRERSHHGIGAGKVSAPDSAAGTRKGAGPEFGGLQHEKREGIAEEKMETLVKRAHELGADKAKMIDPATVVVEEWVRWKCQYGCPLYEKDAYHPPCAPPAESAKKVVKEYSKAILMNGPKGKELTEAVVRLEGEAYQMGYYKAFAMTALSSGPEGAA
jgi:hypothetical protein